SVSLARHVFGSFAITSCTRIGSLRGRPRILVTRAVRTSARRPATGGRCGRAALDRPRRRRNHPRMQVVSVRSALAGQAAEGSRIEVRGWVRTRRDSKAGISFVQISDGSCQGTLQIVAPNALANYQSEVLRLTAGSSLIARGALVKSQGKGQAFEMQADEI